MGRETAALDPTASTGQVVTVQNPREREVNSVQEILASRAIVEAAVDELGVDAVLPAPSGEPGWAERLLAPVKWLKQKYDTLDAIPDRERAVLLAETGGDAAVIGRTQR